MGVVTWLGDIGRHPGRTPHYVPDATGSSGAPTAVVGASAGAAVAQASHGGNHYGQPSSSQATWHHFRWLRIADQTSDSELAVLIYAKSNPQFYKYVSLGVQRPKQCDTNQLTD